MTLSRIAALIALVAGVVVLAVVAFRGGDAPRYTLVFEDAGGLIPGNLVRVNGIDAGTVQDIGVRKDPQTGQLQAAVEVEITDLGPLRQGTEAQIRATSLGGIANKYVALQLAPNNAPELEDEAVIGMDETRGIVSQDELVNAFDEPTRKGLQELVKGADAAVAGNSEDLTKVLESAPTTLKEARQFVAALNADDDALRDVIANFAAVDSALVDRTETISRLTANTSRASSALAGSGSEIATTLAAAPEVLDEATQTFEDLPAALDEVQRLIETADRYKAGVPERLRQLTEVLDEGNQQTIAALARSLNKPGEDNDVADLLAATVAVGREAGKARESLPVALEQGTPLLAQGRAYAPDVIAAVNGLGLVAANYDAAGHYLRVAPQLGLFQGSGGGATVDLVPRSTFDNRLQGLLTVDNRCPGSAAQAPADGSAPYTDGGKVACDPADVPPGGGG